MRRNILISKAVRFWAAFDFSFGKAGFTLKFLTSRQSRVARLAGARPFCLPRRHFPALRGIALASRGGFWGRGVNLFNPVPSDTPKLFAVTYLLRSPIARLPFAPAARAVTFNYSPRKNAAEQPAGVDKSGWVR